MSSRRSDFVGGVTVFSGPERRRNWSSEERLRILTEAFSSGASVARVARRHDISTGLIYTWRRKLRAGAAASAEHSNEVGFVEAVVVDDTDAKASSDMPAIIVDLAQVGRVTIFASAPAGTASAVLRALAR